MSTPEWEEPHGEALTEEERRFEEALRQLAGDTPVSPDFCARVLAATQPSSPTSAAAENSAGAGAARPRRRFRFPSRLSLAVSGLAAGLVLSLAANVWLTFRLQTPGTQQGTLEQDVQRQLALQRQAFTLLTAPEAHPVPLRSDKADSRARGFLLVEPDDLHAVLIVQNLPPLPQDRAYQLWLGWGDRQRDNGGVFRVDEQGFGLVYITAPRPFTTYQRVGITDDPASGSPGPISPRVIGGTPAAGLEADEPRRTRAR
jgi:hypothetical protein